MLERHAYYETPGPEFGQHCGIAHAQTNDGGDRRRGDLEFDRAFRCRGRFDVRCRDQNLEAALQFRYCRLAFDRSAQLLPNRSNRPNIRAFGHLPQIAARTDGDLYAAPVPHIERRPLVDPASAAAAHADTICLADTNRRSSSTDQCRV
jgi:hypothetical protein